MGALLDGFERKEQLSWLKKLKGKRKQEEVDGAGVKSPCS